MFDAITLEGADVVAIAQLRHQILEDPPITIARSDAVSLLDMILEVVLDPVVVDQRVVDIDEKDDRMRQCHAVPHTRLCHGSSDSGQRQAPAKRLMSAS